MKIAIKRFFVFFILVFSVQCKKETNTKNTISAKNEIHYAKGFSIENYSRFSILKITNPWPNATKSYTYILKEKNAKIPDSLKQFPSIAIPVQTIVATSTTHIPSLELLNEEKTLVGFPNLNLISSEKVRALIDAKKIKEIGVNQSLNTEVIINLQPNVIVANGINNNNPTFDNLEKNGLKIIYNGDWNEPTVLGRAEWIKFFGALYGKQKKANEIFSKIENDYLKTIEIAKKATSKPTILAGDLYQGKWYLPSGNSWGSLLFNDANGNYLWNKTNGTGSLSLSFETVFEKAQNANFWISSLQYSTLKEMELSNVHYAQFKAFQNKNVYTFAQKKGKTGGVLYYELAPNRPDIVLKDLVKILHPELLKSYKPFFFEKLK